MAAVIIQAMKDAIGVANPTPRVVADAKRFLKGKTAKSMVRFLGMDTNALGNISQYQQIIQRCHLR